ncbi:MAG: hypothetical protein IIW72_05595, partial [Clostridia bacterium]|nr:hypothetical protein [Clostridia bacterium]
MGAKLLVFPDKVYLNTNDLNDYGSLEAEFLTADGSEVTFCLCKSDGSFYNDYYSGTTPPVSPEENDLWVDTSVSPNELKQYSTYTDSWVSLSTTYIRIAYSGIGTNFNQYDSVTISGCENNELNNTFVIWDKSNDYIVITGILKENFSQNTPLKIERRVPEMDFFCENGNRVWGCSSETNEIFACKLGDPTNWQAYMGIATDSYTVSV